MIQKKNIAILGMMCAGCSARVEQKLKSLEGIHSASVNLSSRTALVEFDPSIISLEQMKTVLSDIGYDMVIEEDRNIEAIERQALNVLRRKVVLSWLFALTVMALSMGIIKIGSRDITNQFMLILALLNLIYCGQSFYISAWRQLRHRSANMDSLVALSTAISFLFSAFNTFWGEQVWEPRGIAWHTYFDASVMIISFVLTGRLLEERAKHGTATAIRALMGLQPKTAHLIVDGSIVDTALSVLQRGDTIEVRPGEKIPVDGTVVGEGTGLVDESMISGEPYAVAKQKGDKVYTGTLVREGIFRFRAEEVGQKTMLAHIIRMVQEAQGSKAPVQRVVDRIALIFVPAVIAMAGLTFLVWLLFGGSDKLPEAILSAVSVLVIACPCAMGLATPTALMVGIGKAAQKNILIKDATALEELRSIDAMVIDNQLTPIRMIDGKGNVVTFGSSWEISNKEGHYGIPAQQKVTPLEAVLIKTTAEQKFLPTRCGFTWEMQNATAKKLSIVHLAASEVTSLKNIIKMENSDENLYDLSGRKVSQNSKGLLIQNGKKMVVK